MVDIFRDGTKSMPKKPSAMIVRVPMDQLDVGGRKDHLPNQTKSDIMSISHVPNRNP
jgi:hypothetical protein